MTKQLSRSEKPATLRCFFGLAYPLSDALSPLIDRLGQLAGEPDTRLRLIDPLNMHITLKFLGSVEGAGLSEVSTLARAVCARHSPLTLTCAGLGLFRDSIWVGIRPLPELTALAAALEQGAGVLGVQPEGKTFMPHITVARFGREGKARLNALREEFAERRWGEFSANKVQLYRSETLPDGAKYTILENYPLGSTLPLNGETWESLSLSL